MKKSLFTLFGFLLLFGIEHVFTFSYKAADSAPAARVNSDENLIKGIEIPKDISFAGEKLPTDIFDVSERLDKELLVNTYWQSQTILFFKRANRWFPVIEPILKKYNVPDDFKYLALAESGLTNVVSPAGATGFWQFLQPAAKKYGLEVNDEVDERYHIERSTEAACRYLKDSYEELGSWFLAAASYNMGLEGVKRQMDKQKQKSYFDLYLNEETSRYIFRLAALKEVYSNPEKYGYKLSKKNLYPAIPSTTFTVDSCIPNLVDFAISKGISYKALRLFNPWIRQYALLNKEKRKYLIKVPDSSFHYRDYIDRLSDVDSVSQN